MSASPNRAYSVTTLAVILAAMAACGAARQGGSGQTNKAMTPCSTPRTPGPAPRSLAVNHVAVSLPDPAATIVPTKDAGHLIPLGNSFILSARGQASTDSFSGKGIPGPDYEYQISTTGRILASRRDWQIDVSPIDRTIFVLGGPGDHWTWVHESGRPQQLTPDWSLTTLFRDSTGHLWATGYNKPLVEFADGTTPETVAYGDGPIYDVGPACDGAVWVLTRAGSLVRIVGGDRTEIAHVTFDTTVDTALMVPASDGSVWLVMYHSTGDFTGYEEARRYTASGAMGKPVTLAQDSRVSALIGPDGALWGSGVEGVFRLGSDGDLHWYRLSARDLPPGQEISAGVQDLAAGPDGLLWYACSSREICSIVTQPVGS